MNVEQKPKTAKPKPPSHLDFLSTLRRVPGLGPKRIDALDAAGIKTVGDLVNYYPARYIDRSKIINICDLGDFVDNTATVKGVVESARTEYFGRARFRAVIKDDSGARMDAIWYIRSMKIAVGETLALTGKVLSGNNGRCLMIHPTLEKITEKNVFTPIIPVYSIREPMREAGVNQKLIRNAVGWVIKNLESESYPRILPAAIENRHTFPPLEECLRNVHLPEDLLSIDKYKERLKYEELYRLALNLRWNRRKFALPGFAMSPGVLEAKVRAALPFELTESQERAVRILYSDAAKPLRMHRLLQGDVGSGKTITALMSLLPALNSGKQAAWMAPTEVLAKQTKSVVDKYLAPLGIGVGYIGSGDAPEKRQTLQDLACGKLRLVIGTHALFMPSVRFKNLGMIVIDEQHKFGAAQRLKLQEKDPASDFLMMSATPIPQTLAKTLYGDLDVVDITSRPGRAPISTHIVPPQKIADMEKFILEQINNNARVFYVAPRIERRDDEDDDDVRPSKAKPVKSSAPKSVDKNGGSRQSPLPGIDTSTTASVPPSTVDSVVERLKSGPLSLVPIHKLHGQMSPAEREASVAAFKDGPPGILVSTTIVEVGVDIQDATVMVIENPEYFGLAQLHQIRGRVGRANLPSYCFLLPGDSAVNSENSTERLKFLCGSRDGFEIAEWDLRNRGPGDTTGYRQSGWDDLCAADILNDAGMFQEILRETESLFGLQ